MPYTKQERRADLDEIAIEAAATLHLMKDEQGDLNYFITRVGVHLLARQKMGYTTASHIRAGFDDASAEWYRRVMAPYEDIKCTENGDVYDHEIL
jgi:hypothetical protein